MSNIIRYKTVVFGYCQFVIVTDLTARFLCEISLYCRAESDCF